MAGAPVERFDTNALSVGSRATRTVILWQRGTHDRRSAPTEELREGTTCASEDHCAAGQRQHQESCVALIDGRPYQKRPSSQG
jgi:hypothetical protein